MESETEKKPEPAFPCPVGHVECYHPTGMTLRDYFAAKAMTGLLAVTKSSGDDIAKAAFIMADAMLKARQL